MHEIVRFWSLGFYVELHARALRLLTIRLTGRYSPSKERAGSISRHEQYPGPQIACMEWLASYSLMSTSENFVCIKVQRKFMLEPTSL